MDIHDQHIAKLKAVHQHEIETSEAKHRLLANLIPQIIFTATEEDGITFANEQWFSYTGQSSESSLGLGFIDFVHPDDLAKCRIPNDRATATTAAGSVIDTPTEQPSPGGPRRPSLSSTPRRPSALQSAVFRDCIADVSSTYDLSTADLSELAKKGIIKVSTDSNGRLSYTTELRLRSKTGEYRWHLIRCVEIDNIDFVGNGASSFFGSATDINDHKLLEAKLKEAMESKGRFLSNMSHEIRTPLIGISGMVSFLQDTTLNEEQRDFTNTIQTSANSLLMIINDILDLSKVDAGMMKLKYEWFHTRSLIEDVNELVSTMAIAKRLELNYIVEENVPSWVKGDKVRIRQVLLNVIGNAIKFTSEGEVFSRCRVVSNQDSKLDDNQIMLEFSVIDTGRGFSQEEAELIFKPFSQIDGSSTRQHGGSGLGLVISRQLVELHGDADPISPALTSSAGSDPSVRSLRSVQTARSSISSVNTGLVRFSEAAKASGQDLSQMNLEMPSGKVSPQMTPLGAPPSSSERRPLFRPPIYSILVICPQKYSREAITKHIEMTLPKDTPYQITAMATVSEAEKLIGGHESVTFTHIVLNLGSAEEVTDVIDQIMSSSADKTSVLVLSDSVQRQAVLRLISGEKHRQLLAEKRINFIYKPVKPSRFAVIFDPAHERDLSIDLNRSNAAQMVESQKQNYLDVEKRIGNKGYKVLLVEDNPVNQKVLVRYLKKVGIDAEIATDGVECTDKVFSHPPHYYSLILCDLHMPRKDGYQACKEIRQWEEEGKYSKMPIIALSANVMSDVQDKCSAAGFSDYVTKPVDFVDLSKAMSKYF
ncbi:putative histidine kinase hhk2p protein [Eutypa lata UCREL1]|uniref:histidine kinase n=1 Tax=Eutypa lata (strain UCR-EL1) TaxID=1287681 RepID=M7U172_EUTLA|nr:putative histidine kinase hhk2p protein [Eutypa lata UCREL1]